MNEIDYRLRQFFRWRRQGLAKPGDPAVDIFAHLHGAEKDRAVEAASRLEKEYRLQALRNITSPGNFRENLFYLSMLEQSCDHFGLSFPDPIRVVDVGVSHWFYVQALTAFLYRYHADNPRTVTLDGYELDPFRVYADLHSRYDHALVNINNLPGVTYHPEGFKPTDKVFDIAFQFFPFIFIKDHREWGIPDGLFDPQQLLKHIVDSLTPDGILFVVNQGMDESRAQLEMMTRSGLSVSGPLEIDPLLFKYDFTRYVLVGKKHG